MSYIMTKDYNGTKATNKKVFYGINRSESASENEFYDMNNMSSDKYPYLSPEKLWVKSAVFNRIFVKENGAEKEEEIGDVRAVISPDEETEIIGFSGVIGNKFYYNGYEKTMKKPAIYENGSYKFGMEIAADGKIQLLWSNKTIIIHGYDCSSRTPYIYYYDTTGENGTDDYVKSYEYEKESYYREYEMSVKSDGTAKITYQYKALADFKGEYFDFKEGDSVFIDGLMTYSDSRWDKLPKNYITSAVVTSYSEVYSSYNNGYYIWNIELNLRLYNQKNENPVNSEYVAKVYHIYKKIPYMTHIALHKGRLWGANPNGEYVYGSALGDIFNFNSFNALSDDSVFLESSTQGGYRGVVSCSNSLIAFKRNEMEAIYGELPNEFAVGKRYDLGCRDIESAVLISGVLYFLSDRGFYVWTGSTPEKISEELSKEYQSAFSISDGIKYYTSAVCNDGSIENLIFTPQKRLWHKLNDKRVNGGFKLNGELYLLFDNAIFKKDENSYADEWMAESVKCFYNEYLLDRVSELWISAKIKDDGKIEVYVSSDDGEWKHVGTIKAEGNKKIYRIPVRLNEGFYWRYKLIGKKDAIIYGIKAITDAGGRIYSNERIGDK